MNLIEIRYLRHGYYKEKTRITSDVCIKPSETPKQYVKRILDDGNITDVMITKVGGMAKDKGIRP
jgi:hypothetical protein